MTTAHINRKCRTNGCKDFDRDHWTTLCGRYLPYQFALMGLEHAESCLRHGTLVTPCKKCLRIARKERGRGEHR